MAVEALREYLPDDVPATSGAALLADLAGNKYPTVRDLGIAQDARFKREHGIARLDPSIPEHRLAAAEGGVYDILTALSKNGSGFGWYADKIVAALQEVGKLRPEILTDRNKATVFLSILASTSQGNSVFANFKMADAIYGKWVQTGKMPQGIELGKAGAAIEKNLRTIDELMRTYGPDKFEKIMDQEVFGGTLTEAYGLPVSGITKGGKVPFARFLGPKIGSFFGNLRGHFNTTTMDLWFTRTMNRYFGETTGDLAADRSQTLLGRLRTASQRQAGRVSEKYGLSIEDMKTDDAAARASSKIMQKWGQNDKFKGGTKVEKAARALSIEAGMKNAPQNKTQRTQYDQTVRLMQKLLSERHGINLDVADIQAILWYTEKSIFDTLGQATKASRPADYLDAGMALRADGPGLWGDKLAKQSTYAPGENINLLHGPFRPIPEDVAPRRLLGKGKKK